jgi:MinD-like ATPase involved in chromosome partitioning or flagellar assembly
MKISVIAKKGGVGKSTVSLLLYEAFRHAVKTVMLHDWDAQGTSTKALELIYGSQANTTTQAEITIYDTPPSLEHIATVTAVRSADLVLVVTTPAPADIWEAEEAVQFVQGTKNDKTVVRVVFNQVRKTTILGRLVDTSAKEISVSTLPVMLSDRECYKHAIAQGWKALDGSAREEVLQFAVSLLSLNA